MWKWQLKHVTKIRNKLNARKKNQTIEERSPRKLCLNSIIWTDYEVSYLELWDQMVLILAYIILIT
jgi:hypothetical protein